MNIKGELKFVSTDVRRGWVLCNIVLAAGPIAVTILSGSPNIFPATLTYCYALLLVGAYLFYRYVRSHDITEQGDTTFWVSIVFAGSFLIILMGYYSNPSIVEIVNSHWATTISLSSVIIVAAFVLAYKLNWPIISAEEAKLVKAEKEAKERYAEAEVTRLGVRKAAPMIKADLARGKDENL